MILHQRLLLRNIIAAHVVCRTYPPTVGSFGKRRSGIDFGPIFLLFQAIGVSFSASDTLCFGDE
jgi:hypothetical protein